MDYELIEVLTVTAELADAQRIAAVLLDRRLAACTQIHGPLESSYWWNDRIETTREWQLVAKTKAELYAATVAAISESHPYDVPEILAIGIVGVSPGYRMWLLGQLAIPPKISAHADEATKTARITDSTVTKSKRAKAKKDSGS